MSDHVNSKAELDAIVSQSVERHRLEFPWAFNNYQEWVLDAPCKFPNGRMGNYEIHITPRPRYCDRGDWLIHMDGVNDTNDADLFPRFFFGTIEEAKRQMETFLLRREAFRQTL